MNQHKGKGYLKKKRTVSIRTIARVIAIVLAIIFMFAQPASEFFSVYAAENQTINQEETSFDNTSEEPSGAENTDSDQPMDEIQSNTNTEEQSDIENNDFYEESGSENTEDTSDNSDETEAAEDVAEDSSDQDSVDREELDLLDLSTASYIVNDNAEAADVQGKATESLSAAKEYLENNTELNSVKIRDVAKNLFLDPLDADGMPLLKDAPVNNEEENHRAGDGTTIESVSARWITPDTIDNGDPNLLYLKPSGDDTQSVRLQINYALSGEHNYAPGDVTITVPAYIFKNRNGNDYGNLVIPFPEDPSTKGDFNWKLVDDKYVLTNTKRMSAATKGYVQFAVTNLVPHDLVDMQISDEFSALIEVVTHKDNLLYLESNKLSAQVDTDAQVTDVSKRVYQSPQRVSASSLNIPASIKEKYPDETEYIKVDWYLWGYTSANTMYTLHEKDQIPQDAVVQTIKNEDGSVASVKTEADFDGFLLNATSEDGTILEKDLYTGYQSGRTSYYYYSTVYPASQFAPDTDYTFHNNVQFTLTETDDPSRVTTKNYATQTTWSYTNPKWEDPYGHFMVVKNGNDDTANHNYTHRQSSTSSYVDTHRWSSSSSNGWYGIYPSALNDLQDQYELSKENGEIRLSYTIDSVGYVMPWMFDNSSFQRDGAMASRKSINYSRPVTMTTMDKGIGIGRNGAKLELSKDYEYDSIEFPDTPWLYYGKPQNINPDGSFTALTAGDGSFVYTRDYDMSRWPDITLEIQQNGEWIPYATVSWKSGSFEATLADGTKQTSHSIAVPSDTENFRTSVTLQNTSEDAEANIALQAAIDYDVRVVLRLKSTNSLIDRINKAFKNSNTPEIFVYNEANMTAVRADVEEDNQIVSIDKDGYDSLRGYTTDTMVVPTKDSKQTLDDVDYENRTVTIHYTAKVEERSVINDKKTYEQAIEDGRLIAETKGVWRDLLPKGVTPDLDSISLNWSQFRYSYDDNTVQRNGDRVLAAYAYENYAQSGRTLLVVEVALTPTPQRYRTGDMYYYEDVPAISFDAFMDFETMQDYYSENGEDIHARLHNVISFESGNPFIGTVDKYSGEPDDPNGGQNVSTASAFNPDDAKEKTAMTDLDPNSDDPNFVYAGTYTKIDILSAARTSLHKDVQVNNDGRWSTGVWEKEAEKAEEERIVYEGGQYSYRLRMMSDDQTQSKDLVLYDSLEDFKAGEGNASVDIDVPTWQGIFREVDVSQLTEKGCAPVVYYSTQNLKLSEEEFSDTGYTVTENVDLTNTEVWTEANTFLEEGGNLSEVKSVAIDASKRADGSDFVLEPLESVMVVIRMQAPSGEAAREYIAQDAHAYNNAYLLCTSVDKETGETDNNNFIRKDYTKVGLMEHSYDVFKVWKDDNNRDGIRPESVEFRLLANGEVVLDEDGNPVTVTLPLKDEETGELIWKGTFEHIPYTDADGNKIIYTATEIVPEGYSATGQFTAESAAFTNIHVPEKTSIDGVKNWVGDTADARPESIQLTVLANGEIYHEDPGYQSTITVKPDSRGNWNYSFDNLLKYKDGQEIVYTVKEVVTGSEKLQSYLPPEYDETGLNVTNRYYPYGDLEVSKAILNTTAVSKETEFEFTFEFTKGTDEDGQPIPVFAEYKYVILDGNTSADEIAAIDWEQVTDTVATNESISIKGGQKIYVNDIDEYVSYKVTEKNRPGFALTSSSNGEGTVKPNDLTSVAFENTYSANGSINLKAEKTLKNKKLNKYQFRFNLYEVTENEEGTETETLIRTASNGAPEQIVPQKDELGNDIEGTVASSAAPVTFGEVRYTQDDANKQAENGKPYVYRIKEENTGKAGYQYDTTVYTVYVSVTDNGDGTLSVVPTYYKENEAGELEEIQNPPSFENRYHAEGEITLRAWKDLQGRVLQTNEFSFELLDEKGIPIASATNTADGSVAFIPEHVPELKFDESDIGRTYHFAIREVQGSDATVNYDNSVYGYNIEVLDNGDGTLTLNQGLATPIYGDASPCGLEHGNNARFSYDITNFNYIGYDNPDFTEAWENMANAFSDVGIIFPQSGGSAFCKGTNTQVLNSFNRVLEILGLEQRATSTDTVFVTVTPPLAQYYSATVTVGYFCSFCGGTNGVCQTCGGTGKLTPVIVEGTPFSYYAPSYARYIYSSPSNTYSEFLQYNPGFRTVQIYARICELGGTYVKGNEHDCQWYINQYMHWRNNYDSLGLPYDIDTRVPYIEYTGEDEVLAELFGVDPTVSTHYEVRMLSGQGFAHGSGNAAYVIQATCDQTYDCPECKGTGIEQIITGWNTETAQLPVFTNTLKPGSLAVSKSVYDAASADPTQDFQFKVKLIGAGIEDGEKTYKVRTNAGYEDKTVNIQDGEFEFTLHGGEQAAFDDLPAGTAYQVFEEITDGWLLTGQGNVSGTIQPLVTTYAYFTNKYQPGSTSVQFVGTKLFDGRAAEANAFTFVLKDTNGEPVQTVKTLDGGFIQFAPITYTEPGTYYYTIQEVDPEDDTLDWDTSVKGIKVTVGSDGKGGLFNTVEYLNGNIAFENKTRPGSLEITKIGENLSDANKDDEFTFEVTLYNEKGIPLGNDEDIYWYRKDSDGNIVGKSNSIKDADQNKDTEKAETASVVVDRVEQVGIAVNDDEQSSIEINSRNLVTAADDIASGTSGTCSWVIDADGVLTISPTNGTSGTLASYSSGTTPWYRYSVNDITKVVVKPGVKTSYGCRDLFASMKQCTEMDLKNLDTSNATTMQYMFQNCPKLTSLDLSGWNTSNVTNMSGMFLNCPGLNNLNLTGWVTRQVTNCSSMFENCSGFQGTWDLSVLNCRMSSSMDRMFSGCSGVKDLLFGVYFRNTTSASYMFAGCTNLETISGSFYMTNLSNAAGMFQNCYKLKLSPTQVYGGSNLRYMSYMFQNCRSIEKLVFDRTYTYDVRNMNSMFEGCSNLTSLDISSFNTRSALNMTNMFEGCTALYSITLGESFNFRGNGISTDSLCALLPSHPDDGFYTGNWIRDDKNEGPLSALELRDNYTASMHGTWVWDEYDHNGYIVFDANGGYTSAAKLTFTDATTPFATPDKNTTQYPGKVLLGWSEDADSPVPTYGPGETIDIAEMGKTKTLYAIWTAEGTAPYTVKHLHQDLNLEGYSVAETEYFYGEPGSSVTPDTKTYTGFLTPESQTVQITADGRAEVEYKYDRMLYSVKFDGNGSTSGAMGNQLFIYGVAEPLNSNIYSKKGSIFTGWNTEPDGSGDSYSDEQAITLDVEHDTLVTFYAQWRSNEDSEQNPTNGVITVRCKAGETIVIPDLPAGTRYSIKEMNNPSGWTQTGIVNPDGMIIANETSSATVTNTYEGDGNAYLVAHKKVSGDKPQPGQFSFELLDQDHQVIQTKTNDEVDEADTVTDDAGTSTTNSWKGTAPVQFDVLNFKQVGTYTFYIREVEGNDEQISYDAHEETVTVTVTDAGKGVLETSVTYDSDGALFVNNMNPTNLKISKKVVDESGSAPEETFNFKVELKDSEGNPLEGSYPAAMEEKLIEETMHSDNISDDGTKQSDYGYYQLFKEVKTIPGAEKIHVKLTYSNVRGVFWIWNGDYSSALEDVYSSGSSPSGFTADFNPNMAYKTYSYTSGEDDKLLYDEFDVPGDSVTIIYDCHAFASDGSYPYYNEYSNYGYYAELSSNVIEKDKSVQSGDTITLKGGEYIEIFDLPHGTTYTVTEELTEKQKESWTQTGVENPEGTLQAGEVSEAIFENTYREPEPYNADGTIQLKAHKKVKGGFIEEEDEFTFQLLDESGEVLQTKTCDTISSASENGKVSESDISFDPISYRLSDAGKTFTYFIQEKAGIDDNVIYDKHIYKVQVEVSDNGDETLTASAVYTTTENGEVISEDKEGQMFTCAEFVNEKGGSLIITKELTAHEHVGERIEPATFVFQIEGTSPDGEVVFSDVRSMIFNEAGRQEIEINNLPVGTKVVVKEIYAGGNYKISGNDTLKVTIEADDSAAEVNFTNSYDNTFKGGGSVTNTIIDAKQAEQNYSQEIDEEAK